MAVCVSPPTQQCPRLTPWPEAVANHCRPLLRVRFARPPVEGINPHAGAAIRAMLGITILRIDTAGVTATNEQAAARSALDGLAHGICRTLRSVAFLRALCRAVATPRAQIALTRLAVRVLRARVSNALGVPMAVVIIAACGGEQGRSQDDERHAQATVAGGMFSKFELPLPALHLGPAYYLCHGSSNSNPATCRTGRA